MTTEINKYIHRVLYSVGEWFKEHFFLDPGVKITYGFLLKKDQTSLNKSSTGHFYLLALL